MAHVQDKVGHERKYVHFHICSPLNKRFSSSAYFNIGGNYIFIMRAITPVFSVLLIVVLSVTMVSILWLFMTGALNSLTSTGTSTVSESMTTISSCMKIESVYGNSVSLRNCGNGVITGDTLSVYIDDIPLGVVYEKYFGSMSTGTGEESYPGNDAGGSSYMGGSLFTMSEDGIITMITAYVYRYDFRSSNAKALIYSDNNGVPGNLLAISSSTVSLQNSPRWENFSITYTGKANTPYWLVIFGSTGHHIGYDTVAINQESASWGNSGFNVPNPFNQSSPITYSNFKESIYATYTPVVKKDGVETVSLSGLWNFNPGRHTLRVTNPRVEAEVPVDAVLPDSAVLDLEFNEGQGAIAYDSSGNENNGILYGSLSNQGWSSSCISGKCLNFNGASDYVSTSSFGDFSNGFTVTLWFNMKPSANRQRIFWSTYFTTCYVDSGSTWMDCYIGNGNAFSGSIWASGWSYNSWTHFALSYDTNSGNWIIYRNGLAVGYGTYNNIMSMTNPFCVGANCWFMGSQDNFNGTIDSVRIFNQSLNPDQTISLRPVSYD